MDYATFFAVGGTLNVATLLAKRLQIERAELVQRNVVELSRLPGADEGKDHPVQGEEGAWPRHVSSSH